MQQSVRIRIIRAGAPRVPHSTCLTVHSHQARNRYHQHHIICIIVFRCFELRNFSLIARKARTTKKWNRFLCKREITDSSIFYMYCKLCSAKHTRSTCAHIYGHLCLLVQWSVRKRGNLSIIKQRDFPRKVCVKLEFMVLGLVWREKTT